MNTRMSNMRFGIKKQSRVKFLHEFRVLKIGPIHIYAIIKVNKLTEVNFFIRCSSHCSEMMTWNILKQRLIPIPIKNKEIQTRAKELLRNNERLPITKIMTPALRTSSILKLSAIITPKMIPIIDPID